eukprot:13918351-Ditylum_brightwellii.AAC.1
MKRNQAAAGNSSQSSTPSSTAPNVNPSWNNSFTAQSSKTPVKRKHFYCFNLKVDLQKHLQ